MTSPLSSILILPIDCTTLPLEYVAQLDVMIVDPPYREAVHRNTTSCSDGRGVWHRDLGFRHLSYQLRRTIAAFASVVRRWSIIYSDTESINVWRHTCEAQGAEYIRPVPWVRWSMPQLTGDRPPQGHEFISIYHRQQIGKRGAHKPLLKHWNGPGNLTDLQHEPEVTQLDLAYFDHKCLRGENKYKAEKPLDQLLDLVCYFSDPGEVVFDPTCGVGTTARACQILGRRCVATETIPEVAQRATARLQSPLSAGERVRVERWIEATTRPIDGEVTAPALERRARRLADVERARAFLAA